MNRGWNQETIEVHQATAETSISRNGEWTIDTGPVGTTIPGTLGIPVILGMTHGGTGAMTTGMDDRGTVTNSDETVTNIR